MSAFPVSPAEDSRRRIAALKKRGLEDAAVMDPLRMSIVSLKASIAEAERLDYGSYIRSELSRSLESLEWIVRELS